ncbi:hypothetical protein PMZ80_011309 [Knufia obscura]|uniref:Uncharacterized protein n=1 Tax=Knufia obscura TaxID=1635080 RepID=A0ABR0R8E2_9EURO|nr:hypothetical protein PMZ80_011309 [Knufia obscura]
MTVSIHADDPWIFARFIQYLYESDYENSQKDFQASWPPRARNVSLRKTIGQLSHTEAPVDASVDCQRRSSTIHCLVINLADKYDAPELLSEGIARLVHEFHPVMREDGINDRFWSCRDTIGSQRISRHGQLQDAFANIAARYFPSIESEELQKWCREDATMCWQITRSLSQHKVEAEGKLRSEIDRIDALLAKSKRRHGMIWT